LEAKLQALCNSLTTRFRDHHAFQLERMPTRVEDLEALLAALSERIEAACRPFAAGITCCVAARTHPPEDK